MAYLIITILADTIGVACLDRAKGFTEPLYLIAGLLLLTIGFVAFSFATKTISLAIANAFWCGMSIALVVTIDRFVLGHQLSIAQYFCLLFVIAGSIGLQITEKA